MATTKSNGNIQYESDGVHVTFTRDCDLGLTGESKWMSASIARDVIRAGNAVLSDPAPKAS